MYGNSIVSDNVTMGDLRVLYCDAIHIITIYLILSTKHVWIIDIFWMDQITEIIFCYNIM